MKLDPPLSNIVARCQTLCVAECCGVDAYDFSPIHIASGLLMFRNEPDAAELRTLRAQIEALKANYGSSGSSARGVTIEEMNQVFKAAEIDRLADELAANLDIALGLINEAATSRFRDARPLNSPPT
jgi:hypothetical protein